VASSDSLRYQELYKTDILQSVNTPIKTAFTKHLNIILSPSFTVVLFNNNNNNNNNNNKYSFTAIGLLPGGSGYFPYKKS